MHATVRLVHTLVTRCRLPFISVGFLWLLSAASIDVWLISALDRGIELRSAAGAAAPVGVALDVSDVTSAFAAAILSAPVCKMNV